MEGQPSLPLTPVKELTSADGEIDGGERELEVIIFPELTGKRIIGPAGLPPRVGLKGPLIKNMQWIQVCVRINM